MDHIAIDLGGKESQICVRASDGRVVEEKRMATAALRAWLATRPTSRVIMETCSESLPLADAARQQGHDVRVVHAMLVKSLGVGSRRTKNDRRDAQMLSEASCRIELPSVHISSTRARERKTICGARDVLVKARTELINFVRGWMRTNAVRFGRGNPESFTTRFRKAVLEVPTALQRMLTMIEQLNDEIADADRQLEQEVKADPVCVRLMTVPGVGPVTAAWFTATLDESERFADAHQVQSYLGLVPGEDSSSERKQRLSITKAGSARVRAALVQAAWSARRWRPHDPMVRWCLEVEKRRGKRVAVVALARKLAGIMFALWRDASVYNPLRGAMR
jgi:transposase